MLKFKMDKHLIMLAGLPCTGKTTVREKLIKNLKDYDFHDNTQVRRDFGYKKFDPRRDHLVLEEVDRRTENSFRSGKGVILDSIHRHKKRRKGIYDLALKLGKKVFIIECFCSPEESKRRMRRRPKSDNLVGDARDTKIYDKFAAEWSDIAPDLKENEWHISYIRFNSEKNNFERIKIEPEIKEFVELIESIILNK